MFTPRLTLDNIGLLEVVENPQAPDGRNLNDLIWKQSIACDPNDPTDFICNIPGDDMTGIRSVILNSNYSGRETSLQQRDANLTHEIGQVNARTPSQWIGWFQL